MPSDQLFKLIVIGQSKVGKTSFVRQYVNGFFSEGYKVTIGVDFAVKTLEWSREQIVRLQFWDIQGQEDTLPLTRAFYKDADACIIMFDLTDHKSFQYCTLLKQTVDSEILTGDGLQIPCVLLGNKGSGCDMESSICEHSVNMTEWENSSNIELSDSEYERKYPSLGINTRAVFALQCDLASHVVSSQEIDDMSNLLQCTAWKEISVKENRDIEETVRCIVEAIMDRQSPDESQEKTEGLPESQLEGDVNTDQRSCCGIGMTRHS